MPDQNSPRPAASYDTAAFTLSRALIVDDCPLARSVVTRALKRLGVAEVVAAASGLDAQSLLQRGERFSLTICDINMPGMDGVEFIRTLPDPTACGRVLIVSAMEARIQKGVEVLADAYGLDVIGRLEKPLSFNALRDVLDSATTGNGAARKASPAGNPRSHYIPEAADIANGISSEAITPYYQPLIDVGSGEITGVEALARWHHPVHGLLQPGAFLEAAEQHGQMPALSRSFVSLGARDLLTWRPDSARLSIAFNLSGSLLSDAALPSELEARAQAAGLACHQVTLEITETTAPPDWTRALDTLLRLRLKGFRLSLDDFGTGYAALHSLKSAPFDEIKIDRSFVTGAGRSNEATTLLRASVAMAKSLNARIVAEGVETWSDYALVRQLGFDLAQGYFITQPLSANDMGDFVHNWDPSLLDGQRTAS